MARPQVSEKLVGLERITRADIFNAPAERVIALGRLLLCALSTLAIQLEPTEPAQHAANVQLTVMLYLLFAAILVPVTRYGFLSQRTRATIHAADIVFISVLVFLTDGPTSPFFVFFTFALLAATLRWQWQAVVATAAMLTGVLLLAGTKDIDLNTAIIRGAYLLVAGGMLAYVSGFYKRSRERFAMLAPWPMRKGDDQESSSIPQLLAHSAIVLEAPRILAVWEEAEEPYVNSIYWREGTVQETRQASGTFGDLVNPSLAGIAFLTGDADSEFALIPKGPIRIKGPVIDPDLRREFSIRGVATAPFDGSVCKGRVFIFDRSGWSENDLLLAEIIAAHTGIELDRQVAQRQNEEAAASRERARLTRDLHDGVLQSLTAAALQLSLADGALDKDRRSRLDLVKQLLATEQRRIREFVDEAFPKSGAKKYALFSDVQRQLEETARFWNCTASISVIPHDAEVSEALAAQLSLMLAEAVANAARHGGATNVDVEMEKADGQLVTSIRDNGKGFAGRATPGIAAASLRERVCALGGSMSVSSSPAGTTLVIRVPVP
jgi:signal transduction histidine kinase